MDLNIEYFEHVLNLSETNRTAEMRLDKMIGSGEGMINGNDFASELSMLDKMGFEKTTIRINSAGGSVLQGLAIISAMRSVKMTVDTVIDGMAASMAGNIAIEGENRSMSDFGLILVHDIIDNTGSMSEDFMSKFRDSILNILESRTKMDRDTARSVMMKNNGQGQLFSASEALEIGLVDEVVSVKSKFEKPEITNDMSVEAIFEIYNSITIEGEKQEKKSKNQTKIKTKMEKLTAFLGLQNGVDEVTILNAVKAIREKSENDANAIEALENKVSTLEAENSTLIAGQKEIAKEKAVILVENAISEKKLKPESKDSFVEKAINDYDGVKALFEGLNGTAKSEKINVSNSTDIPSDRADWGFEKWSKEDPKGLQKIQNSNPELFEKMFNAQYTED